MSLQLVKIPKEVIKRTEAVPAFMNACLFYGPHDVRYEKSPIPHIKDDEILVKIKASLTCGTDLKTFQRGHPLLIKSLPSTFGHQFSGIITKTGKNVSNFYVGQKVVALNSAPCFKCRFCMKEQFSLCENIEFLNGAYAEYISVPARIVEHNTYPIPEDINFETAASLEGLSVVVHGLDRSEVSSDTTVCILGTGSIGLMFAAVAKLKGAKVISIGRRDFKLQIAKSIGADFVLNSNNFTNQDDLVKRVHRLSDGLGPEVVIEAVGLPSTWELATRLVRRGGLVNFFGGCKKGTKVELDTYCLHYGELRLIGVFHHTPKHVGIALNLLSNALFRERVFEKIITHVLPLRDLEKAFLLHQEGEAIQVALKP